jgi:hypothetical protein
VSNVLYPTFHAAACARGLIASNDLWVQMIGDAAREFMSRRRFAFYFAATIAHGHPPDPTALFKLFLDKIVPPPSYGTETAAQKDERKEKALRRLEYYLRHMGRSCAAVGLPAPTNYNHEAMEQWVADEINADGNASSTRCL